VKKLIYMVAIDHDKSQTKHSDYLEYSEVTWKYWCAKNDVEFKMITKHDDKYGWPIFNKLNVCDETEYDWIGVVDDDTMIRWDTPNIFESLQPGVTGVNDIVNIRYLLGSLDVYKKFFNYDIDLNKYINAGVVFLDNKSLSVYDKLREFYFEHQEELDNWKLGGGREQTLFNYHLQSLGYDINLISPAWNLVHIHRKNMFTPNWQLKRNIPHFVNHSYIWHFTGFPTEQRKSVMEQTWDLVGIHYVS
tara:strand:+ start:2160 stop:2900 length:741 start_codon:yes stop_codon:yes gene_type:complete